MMVVAGFLRNALLAAVLCAGGCQRDPGGPLAPVETSAAGQGADNVAVVREGAISANIAARWSAGGAQSMRITYHNGGSGVARITLTGLKLRRGADEAVLRTAVDATGVDLADARSDNDRAKMLYSLDAGGPGDAALMLAAGATRELDVDFTSFGDTVTAGAGDRIKAMVPLGGAPVAVALVAKSPPF